jgi:hypothetical protein
VDESRSALSRPGRRGVDYRIEVRPSLSRNQARARTRKGHLKVNGVYRVDSLLPSVAESTKLLPTPPQSTAHARPSTGGLPASAST